MLNLNDLLAHSIMLELRGSDDPKKPAKNDCSWVAQADASLRASTNLPSLPRQGKAGDALLSNYGVQIK